MRKHLLSLFVLIWVLFSLNSLAQEGTKQLMPNSSDRLWLEFNVFGTAGQGFGMYNCAAEKRINIRLRAGEKMYFGMKLSGYYSNNTTNASLVYFRVKNPSGTVVFSERNVPTSGTGYISNYTQAITGPNGVKLNGTTISGGYDAYSFTAAATGDYYIEFSEYSSWYDRFALEFFDVTVTDSNDNIITNPGSPNVSAGRLWSKAWQMTTTSFTSYRVNSYFYVFTSDEFINKINFQFYPYSFIFQSNSYGLVTPVSESNYIKRAQSKDDNQTSNAYEYSIYLNDPDRSVWPNTRLAAPKVQVWADNELFFDYEYSRTPQQLTFTSNTINLEKNMPSCPYNSIAIFKINSNIDGFTAILLDLDGDGSYSTSGSDRVIYRDMKKGNNYILWDFKSDAGAEVPVGTYHASATFLGRGPTHFPVYDVEQLDGVQTSAVRPFKKLNTSIYWDDTFISRWGDETGGGLMDETQRKNLVVNQNVPRTWSWNADLEDENFNGNINTMNTWFNAIDLGYSQITLNVSQSATKCVDGLAPYVGDIYKEGLPNNAITFTQLDFTKKFFDPIEDPLTRIRVLSLPTNGTLRLSGVAVTVNQEITLANLPNLTFTPTTNWIGRTSFDYMALNSSRWSMNNEKVYLTVNTAPAISSIADQNLCTNTPSPAIPFTVSDGSETPAANLTVTAYSADPTFVPNSSILIGGSGSNRTIQVTPVANKSGNAIIYVMVDDGLSQAIQEFAVYISPDLEFSGDTTVCVGQDLYLVAQETGALSYEWKYEGTTVSGGTSKILNKTWGTYSAGNWSLTITKGTCTSTRNFEVVISPLTTFTGDTSICVGEELALSAVENNATYTWKKGTETVSSAKQFNKSSAALTDSGTDYTLTVTKAGCTATSPQFEISVINQPNIGLALTGSTVDPGSDGTITVASAQASVTYNVYKDGTYITSGLGAGTNLSITIPSVNLFVGENTFEVRANNGNCEIPMSSTVAITVREPGINVSAISGNTSESGGTATFTVMLKTRPAANVTIPISSSDLTEGTVSTSSLTFTSANWNTPQSVTVTGADDFVVDGNIVYTINIGVSASTDSYYNGIDPADLTLSNTDNDVAAVNVTPTSGLTTTEVGGATTFTVRLASQPSANISFTLSSSNALEGTVSPTNVTFTSGNWNTPQTITITGVDDMVDDGDVLYSIITSATSSADLLFNNLTVADVSVTNLNNDIAGVIVSPTSGLTTTEAGGTATFTIRLATQPTQNVSIALSSSNTAEGNVSPTSVTFTAANWSVPQTITITGVNDDIDDGNISYNIITSNVSSTDTKYNNMNVADVSVVNTNDDIAGITVNPTSGLTTTEAGGTATFTVKLNSRPAANVSIGLSSSNTAEGTVSPVSLIFTNANWNVAQTVTVTGVDDFVQDGNQIFTIVTALAISSDTRYNALNASDVSITNTDNDVAGIIVNPTSGLTTTESGGTATFTVVLRSQPTANVTVGITSSNTAEGTVSPASVTFTASNWSTLQTITIIGVDDAVADGSKAYTIITAGATSSDALYSGLNPSDVSVTNNDNDVAGVTITPTTLTTLESGSAVTFTAVLNTQPTANVTISLSSNNTSEGIVSPTLLTYTSANWNTPQTVTVTPVNDDVDDNDVTYSIITGNASSTDANYNNMNVSDISVMNRDDDTAGATVNPVSGLVTTEAGGTATFTIRLTSRPTANVTIGLSSSNTLEGSVSPASVTFTNANWSSTQMVTVTGVNDNIDDDNVAYTIITSNATSTDPKYNGLTVEDVSVTNTDDDVAGVTVTPTAGLTTTEGGGTATFNVSLNTRPIADVSINLTSNNTNEGTVSPVSLTFTSSNWNTPQNVTVTGVDDDVDDGNVPYTIITANAVSTDTKYSGMDVPDVSVTNTNNDTAGILVTPTSGLSTTEVGGTATFTVRLNTKPTANVSVAISSSNTAEGTVLPVSVTFTSSNWNTPQTITITGVDDDIDDDNIAYTVITAAAVSSDTKYNGLNPSDVSVTNTDNDTVGITVTPTSGLTTTEAGGTATFTVRLNTRPTANVTIGLSSSNTAEGAVSPVSLTFTAINWNTVQTVTVTGVDDFVADGNKSYTVVTSPATSTDSKYNALNAADVSINNTDNDAVGVIVTPTSGLFTTETGGTAIFTVRLQSQPAANVVINITSSNIAEGVANTVSLTFTPANWNTAQSITITGQNDDVDDDDVAYSIIKQSVVSSDPYYNDISVPSVSIINRDDDAAGYNFSSNVISYSESGSAIDIAVSLKSKPLSNVQFAFLSENTDKGTVLPASLTFTPANWSTTQSITITPVNNSIMDGNVTFNIVTSETTTTDTKYAGLNPPDITATCIDDDIAGINVSSISGNTSENGTNATFTIVLNSEPSDDVVINISSSNTAEGSVSPASATFTTVNWNTPVTVTVTGVDDMLADGNQTYTIDLSAATSTDPNYNGVDPTDVAVINADNDAAGITVFPMSGLETTEAGGAATFTIWLNTIPSANVPINFVSDNIAEGTVSPASFTFNSSNWNSPQTITLTGVDDEDNDGNIPYQININVDASCTEPNYKSIAIPSVSVTNLDDINPRAVNDNATTDEDNSTLINVVANDKGLDKGGIVVTVISQPTNGSAEVLADNTVRYTPNGLYNGNDIFTYRVSDGNGGYDEADVTVSVTFADDIPVAIDDSRGTSINTPVVVDVLFNDYGVEDGGILVSISSAPALAQGTAFANADNTITFTPAPGYLGTATFKYKVKDADNDEAEANVTINVRSANHTPVAVNDNVTTILNTAKNINVLANDSGLEDGFGSLTIYTNPANGVAVVNTNRTVTYTPNTGFSGTDTFRYLLIDVDGDYSIATVTIIVSSKPDYLPNANDDGRGTNMNTAVTVDVLVNDTGLEDGVASVVLNSSPVNGVAIVNANNTVTYTPNSGYVGVEIFGYQICDTDGDCSSANIRITVKDVSNSNPIAVADNVTTTVNNAIDINVLANDSGLEDGFGTLIIHSTPAFGTAIVNANRTITYTPTYMFVGEETFDYMVTDKDGDYAIATVTVNVIDRPDYVPVANDDRRGCSFNQSVIVDVLSNDTAIDDTPLSLAITVLPTQGTAVVNPDNTVTFTPGLGFIGAMNFRYSITDNDGDTDDALVTINVKSGTNIVPAAKPDNATTIVNKPVEINVLVNDIGLEDGFGGLFIYKTPAFGSVVVNANRTITYTPSYMFIGVETFQYYVEDIDGDYSLATVTVSVVERPDYLPIANDDNRGCSFNTPAIVDVLVNDSNLDDIPITVAISQQPALGNVLVNPDNTITFTPSADYVGAMTFRYTVTDVDGDTDDALVTVNVKAGTNIVPVAGDDNTTTIINTPVDINVLSNDSGLGDGLGSVVIFSAPTYGTAIVNTNRTVTYTPSYMFIGTDNFQYLVQDIDGDYSIATVTVNVVERPDAKPVANDDNRGCSFNQSVIVNVLINDIGLEDIPIVVSISQTPAQGAAVVNADNTITFTPATEFTGIMVFKYTVTDANGDTDDATVTINVKSSLNIVPGAADDNASTIINTPVDINVLANDSGLEDGFGNLTIFAAPSFGSVIVNSNRTITYTPSYLFEGAETFQYLVADIDGDYSIATVTVTVASRPDYQPIANDDRRGCSFNQPVIVDVLFNDTGLEDIPLVVSISENPAQGLAIVNPNNTISYTPAENFIGEITFHYTVTDADGDSDHALVAIRVKEGENLVPSATDDNAMTIVNTPVTINVLANDTGLDDGYGNLSIFVAPTVGSAVVNANRTITFTPSYMFIGTATFQYLVEDVDGDYSVATVTITVTERPNYIPNAVDDYRGATYNTQRVVDVLVNDTGLDDVPVTVSLESTPANGSAAVNADNTVTYTPNGSYLGMVQFNYRVTDKDGDSDVATVFLNVKVKNMIPVAVDDNVTTLVNTPVNIHVLDNDSLLFEGIKSVYIYSAPSWGTAAVNSNNTITYTPSNWFVGNDELIYLVEDVDGDYDIATIRVSVLENQNAIPVANNDKRATSKNTPVNINVLINDDGLEDGWIMIHIKENPDPLTGTISLSADNTVTFTPALDFLGDASFKYFITDKTNDTSNVATVTVTVKEINYTPIGVLDTISTFMNLPLLIDVVNNDTGLDDGLDYIKLMDKPIHGFAYVYDDRNIKYFPASWFVGTDSLTYMVVDSDGDYGIAKVIITVKDRLDHKPKATPDARGAIKNQSVNVDILFNDTGLEDGGLTLILNNLPLHGTAVLEADNTITYTPATDYLGEDLFYYQVCDFDSDCSSAAVTINVKSSNLLPIAVNDTITTYKDRSVVANVLYNDKNIGDGGLVLQIFNQPVNGTIVVNPDNSITYTPSPDFFGADSLWYIVTDIDGDYSLAKVVIDIQDRDNMVPVAVNDFASTLSETAVLVDVLANDTFLNDGIKSLTILINPIHGTCEVDSNNKITYTPLNGYVGTDVFTYQVCDIDNDCDDAQAEIEINPDTTKELNIPDAFSPNGDGINDTFEVVSIENFGNVSIKVYNRWGNLVYKNSSYKNDWDGTSNTSMAIGSKLPDGTYYYILDFSDSGKMYKGSVFIKR